MFVYIITLSYTIIHNSPQLTQSTKTGAFQLYDINNDGLISYAEMLIIVQSIYSMTGEMVQLPPDEDTAEKRVNQIFALMDLNHDKECHSVYLFTYYYQLISYKLTIPNTHFSNIRGI